MSLHDALLTGDIPRARRMIRRSTGINTPEENGDIPLMHAVRTSSKEYLTQLHLVAGAGVDMCNEIGETALMLALHTADNRGNVSIILHVGADTGLSTRYGYAGCDYALKHAGYMERSYNDYFKEDNSEF